MARVAALIPDLLFGSKAQGVLAQGGHEVTLAGSPSAATDALGAADVVLVDLVSAGDEGIAWLEERCARGELGGVRALATYSHVDVEMRRRAIDAGFAAVVPRSRLMREGGHLLAELVQA